MSRTFLIQFFYFVLTRTDICTKYGFWKRTIFELRTYVFVCNGQFSNYVHTIYVFVLVRVTYGINSINFVHTRVTY